MRRFRTLAPVLALGFLLLSPRAGAQTRGAVQTKQVEPVYPETQLKAQLQGNVLVVARIDTQGRLRDPLVVSTTDMAFSAPALEAVRQWQFRPAMKGGKPIEIFTNVAVRFRIQNENRGKIPEAVLGDLAIFPADAAGKRTAPEGFPLQTGKDSALRAEALLDVPPSPDARTLAVTIDVISPDGKTVVPVFQPPISVPAKASQVAIPVVVQIDEKWQDGVWGLRFAVNGRGAGGGQFWLAHDPSTFHFVVPKS